MLSSIAQVMMSAVAAGGEGGGHGLPAGEPFGFQTRIPLVTDEPSLAFAQWIIWLPAISASSQETDLMILHMLCNIHYI